MGWFETMQDGCYLALCASFGMSEDADESYARFIPAYLPNATTPQAQRDENVCYYAVSERQGTGTDYIMEKIDNSILKVTKTVPCSVLFTFYGPNADDDAEHFWSSLMIDTGVGSPRAILRSLRIVPEGTPARPLSVFETEGTYHRRRCDVRASFNYLDIGEIPVSTIVSAPEVTVKTE